MEAQLKKQIAGLQRKLAKVDLQQPPKQKKGRKQRRGNAVVAPAIQNANVRAGSSGFANQGAVRIARTELAVTINKAGGDYRVLHPSQLPWLSKIAALFERITWHNCRLEWRPAVGTQTDGMFMLGMDWSKLSKPVTTREGVSCLTPLVDVPVWQATNLVLPSSRLMYQKEYPLDAALGGEYFAPGAMVYNCSASDPAGVDVYTTVATEHTAETMRFQITTSNPWAARVVDTHQVKVDLVNKVQEGHLDDYPYSAVLDSANFIPYTIPSKMKLANVQQTWFELQFEHYTGSWVNDGYLELDFWLWGLPMFDIQQGIEVTLDPSSALIAVGDAVIGRVDNSDVKVAVKAWWRVFVKETFKPYQLMFKIYTRGLVIKDKSMYGIQRCNIVAAYVRSRPSGLVVKASVEESDPEEARSASSEPPGGEWVDL